MIEANIIKQYNDTSKEIGAWAARNFPVHRPDLGILEEVGEATHCILKRMQKIRGFDNPETFTKNFEDAMGDIGVYALHRSFLVNEEIDDTQYYGIMNFSTEELLAELASVAAFMIRKEPADVVEVLSICTRICEIENVRPFPIILATTWDRVKQRDWEKNRSGAHESVPPTD